MKSERLPDIDAKVLPLQQIGKGDFLCGLGLFAHCLQRFETLDLVYVLEVVEGW